MGRTEDDEGLPWTVGQEVLVVASSVVFLTRQVCLLDQTRLPPKTILAMQSNPMEWNAQDDAMLFRTALHRQYKIQTQPSKY